MLWRVLFIFYALVLTVSTHWPRLNLGSVGGRSPDKILHFVAFGMLTLMLWRTRWFRSRWLVFFITMAWMSLDELSQNITIVERTASWYDFIASSSGVIVASLWIWAAAPLGGPANRLRLDRWNLAVDQVFASVRCLTLMGFSGLAGAAVGYILDTLSHLVDGEEPTSDARLVTMFITAFIGVHSMYLILVRKAHLRILQQRSCFHCCNGIAEPKFDANGAGVCPHCGKGFVVYQWLIAPRLTHHTQIRLVIRPLLFVVGLIALGMIGFMALLRLARVSMSLHQIARTLNDFGPELLLVIDLAYLLAVAAIAVRVYRKNLARVHDNQDRVCISCGHDLRATPAEFCIGTCGECGTRFVRLKNDSEPRRHGDTEKEQGLS